ncbi:non-ribosomal peptide synthetase [Chryseobacterium angstadtii]|uniref:non-ribosomal peptide synthetase n=1 Tax=Chryseobacterium angstadtii TaxID=558151 RepID=UPI00156A12F5|nr:non-ribosomal peptide synthetase [Chryseobacterium angstadtii]
MKDFIEKLKENNIKVVLNNDDLEVISYVEHIPDQLLKQLKEQKAAIVQFLKGNTSHKISINEDGSFYYKTSHAQREIWAECQISAASLAYNLSSSIHKEEVFYIEPLRKALDCIIHKYEILRTNFKLDPSGELKQVIHQKRAGEIIEMDYTHCTYEDGIRFINENHSINFDLEKDSLLRCYLIHLPNKQSILGFTMHHIISDEWSVKIFEKELFEMYNAYLNKEEPELKTADYQYRDYIDWHEKELDERRGHKEYWKNILLPLPETVHLPTYRVKPPVRSYGSRTAQMFLSVQETYLFNELVQKQKGSLFVGILTVAKILLSKYNHHEDVTIGSPMAVRERNEFKKQLGYFIKILILRNKVSSEDSFNSLFKRIKDNMAPAYEHSIYPVSEILKDVGFKRDQTRNSIFDVSVTFIGEQQDIHFTEEIYPDIIEEFNGNGCKNDIEMHFVVVNKQLCICVNYNNSIYDSETVNQFIKHYKALLVELVAVPDRKLSDVEYLSSEERQLLLNDFNATKTAYPSDKTLIDLFEEQVEKNPEAVAVVFEETVLSYRELDNRANALAYRLHTDHGIQKGDDVGVMLDRSEKQIISILGIMKLGAVYVPIDANLPESRKSVMSEGLELLITGSLFDVDTDTGESLPADFTGGNRKDLKGSDPAYIIYTSGSTGEPKGVVNTHAGILNTIVSQIALFEVESYSRIGQFASFSFDASISEIFMTLLPGKALYLLNDTVRKDSYAFEEYIAENSIDLMTLPPAFFSLLNMDRVQNLKAVITAGEAAVISKTKEYLKYGTFYNAYGPTETSICASVYKIPKGNTEFDTLPIGKPIANTEIYILDEYGHLVPVGISGELYIAGAGLALGYLNREDLTAEKFVDNPFIEGTKMYRTGDMARWLPDGNIEYLGRIDQQVKIRGHRVELGEIDSRVLSYSDAIKAVVTEVKEHAGDKNLVVYYVSDSAVDKQELAYYLKNRLPQYMVPGFYVELKDIPLTGNGKIDRKSLPEVSVQDLIKTEYVAPKTAEEKILVQVCEEILKQNPVSIKDNYYNLGGESIKSIQIVSRLRQLGYTLKVGHILQYPVLEELSKYVTKNTSLAEHSNADFTHESSQKEQESSQWAHGDSIGLSQYQRFFFRNQYAAVNFDVKIEHFDESNFENEVRHILSKFPFLMVKFEKTGTGIIQRYVSEKEINLKIRTENIMSKSIEEIRHTGNKWMSVPYDLFEGDIIRILIVQSENKEAASAQVFFGIHHSLLDEYSGFLLKNALEDYFNTKHEITAQAHYFNFIRRQNRFLASDEGKKQRNEQMQKILEAPLFHHNESEDDTVYVQDFVNQEIFIAGEDFLHLQRLSQQLSLPFNAFSLSIFLRILNDHKNTAKNFYGMLSSNRENPESEEVAGMLIDLVVSAYSGFESYSMQEILANYIHMTETRSDQKIPYEIIRQDIKEKTEKDLEKNIIGFYNYVNYSSGSAEVSPFREYVKQTVAFDGINLKVFEYSDCILLYLTHPAAAAPISLPEYVKEFLNFIKA